MASIVRTVLRFSRVTIQNLYQINQNELRSGKQLKIVGQNKKPKFSEISAVLQQKSRRLLYVPSAFFCQKQHFITIIEEKIQNTNVSPIEEAVEIFKKLRIELQLINIGILEMPNNFIDMVNDEYKRALAKIDLLNPEPDDISFIREAIKNLQKLEIERILFRIEFVKLMINKLNEDKDALEDECKRASAEEDQH
ncbi:uncharacterized protein LOC105432920 [Pogonomyrmex barbatus]|uniref:Uncharacterized protein LOC105432920 n=1 Tax=Pogonomyrmex barbatus TaxID=144034 RepID=A0A6I9X121_9HYME|nr:uncharacterized protein LOC105432920 [Pogonomyrmex barbatus]